MTIDIEKQFYETFGIESKHGIELTIDPTTDDNVMNEHRVCYGYPEITDRILLELICILNKHYSEHYQIASMIVGKNIEEVKKSILNDCIEQSKHKDFKHKIQSLFKENN